MSQESKHLKYMKSGYELSKSFYFIGIRFTTSQWKDSIQKICPGIPTSGSDTDVLGAYTKELGIISHIGSRGLYMVPNLPKEVSDQEMLAAYERYKRPKGRKGDLVKVNFKKPSPQKIPTALQLNKALKEVRITQAEAAEYIGEHIGILGRWLRGEKAHGTSMPIKIKKSLMNLISHKRSPSFDLSIGFGI
jgi:hypothetical protein